jgi:hypothetical protein
VSAIREIEVAAGPAASGPVADGRFRPRAVLRHSQQRPLGPRKRSRAPASRLLAYGQNENVSSAEVPVNINPT